MSRVPRMEGAARSGMPVRCCCGLASLSALPVVSAASPVCWRSLALDSAVLAAALDGCINDVAGAHMIRRPRFKYEKRWREERYRRFWEAVPEPKWTRRLVEDQPSPPIAHRIPVNLEDLPIG